MIRLGEIAVRGESSVGAFEGKLELSGGLQVISADNAFGKSLAAKSVAWCLGAEAIFGSQPNEPTCFPEAVIEKLENPDLTSAQVSSSACSIVLEHHDGRRLRLTRAIKGDTTVVDIEEQKGEEPARTSRLLARQKTMQDETGGLQRFLFEWFAWPRVEVPTFKGDSSWVYMENLMPSLYIDQTEGWADIQAQQIGRYGQMEIKEIATEYLLGAIDAIRARVAQRKSALESQALREAARSISERVTNMLERRGWRVDWTAGGTIDEIIKRWTKRSLRKALKEEANVDFAATMARLTDRAKRLRETLASSSIDPQNVSAPSQASQRAIDLKRRRHELNETLSVLRMQKEQADDVLSSIEHRIHSARDLLRLKTTGVGRLDHVECPTCHRDLDPATFSLNEQSQDSISTHIEALDRDRDMMIKNTRSIEAELKGSSHAIAELDMALRDAERVLITVTAAMGTEREQVAQIAGELGSTERDLDRAQEISAEIDDFEAEIAGWIGEARALAAEEKIPTDLTGRRQTLLTALRKYLVELGHSEVRAGTEQLLTLDEQYVPYFDHRRLRSLGSASDQSRLTMAYALALAASTTEKVGLHPGFVILDEPLQQNPDPAHRKGFVDFLSKQLALNAKFQTVIFTSLQATEVTKLRKQDVAIQTPEGKKWLKVTPPAPEPEPVEETTE
ncbi:MAG TPA: hypothetical protein VE422_30630 [Terriglobia bacterium]|nr:hypothetical protein [Terriglobia bacterium]